MSVRVVLVKQTGRASGTYVNYTPQREPSKITLLMVMKRYQRLGKLVFLLLVIFAGLTLFNSQGTEVTLEKDVEVVMQIKKEDVLAEDSELIKTDEKTKYASYFEDKKVTPNGILPLPVKKSYKPIRKTDSDVPEMFYTA